MQTLDRLGLQNYRQCAYNGNSGANGINAVFTSASFEGRRYSAFLNNRRRHSFDDRCPLQALEDEQHGYCQRLLGRRRPLLVSEGSQLELKKQHSPYKNKSTKTSIFTKNFKAKQSPPSPSTSDHSRFLTKTAMSENLSTNKKRRKKRIHDIDRSKLCILL